MKCNKCGAELEEGALFCGSCGAKAEAAEPVTEAATAAANEEPGAEVPEENPIAAEDVNGGPPPQEEYTAPSQEAEPQQNTWNTYSGTVFQQPDAKNDEDEGLPVSLGTWVCRHLIAFIPCVGWLIYIVMLFVWAFDKKYNSTSRNWAKAELIFSAVSIFITAIIAVILIVNIVAYNTYQSVPIDPYYEYFQMY